MTNITLPDRAPFRDMMAAFTGDGIALIMERKALLLCRHWEATYIDLHAGEFEVIRDELLVFRYTRRQWLALCTEMRHFDPERPLGKPFKLPKAEPLTEYDKLFVVPGSASLDREAAP